MICWSCERAAGDGAICATCGAVQPPGAATDLFAVLGIPLTYQVDVGTAEARFRDLSRQFHPDRFARADPRARRASLQRSVQVNEAWKTIKDPVRRAEYLLQLQGYQIGAEDGASRPVPTEEGRSAARERMAVSPALLGEILELREELADARAAGDDLRIHGMAGQVRARVEAALTRVADGFTRLESTPDQRPEELEAVAGALIAIRYFRRFLEEVAVHDESQAAGAEAARHA